MTVMTILTAQSVTFMIMSNQFIAWNVKANYVLGML